ncbi:hypothetical protein JCM30237_27080 [Halolamina litorea]|uniref:DUF4097 family beta strand repeat-containing protein n=1 Tax=Halolamina litorea TaxID=1515593 RepID=A0ABD6BNU6_9EURY|nr:DUF4097 family beta strand repeat-containing protein [Halolamina litorea]
MQTTRRAALGFGIAALSSLAGCLGAPLDSFSEASESIDRGFTPADVDTVTVVNGVGDVTVRAEETDAVRARVEKRVRGDRGALDDVRVRIDLSDGELTVETSSDRSPALRLRSPTTTVTITVPDDDSAPDIAGVVTQVGDVSLSGTRGNTRVQTEVGDVSATAVEGYLTLETEVGTVTASDCTGLDAATSEVGDVKVDLLALRGDVEVGTDVGDVVVGVADDLDLDVLAESDGGVDSDLELDDSTVSNGRVSGRLNAGGHRLHAYTDVGDVSLHVLDGGA